jgi:hypothetical protein
LKLLIAIVKISILPKAIPIKIPMALFAKVEKSILKFIWEHKRSQIAEAVLSQRNNTGDTTIPHFKLCHRTTWYWNKNRYEDQWNRTEDPDTNPHSFSHLIFNKGAQNMCWKEDSLFNKWCWENWISTYRRLKLDPSLSPCISINSKWIKDLNIRS